MARHKIPPGLDLTRNPVEQVPPPPHESREWHPVNCRRCGRVRTMHRTAECASCGGWAPPIPVTHLRPTDWVLDGYTWRQITSLVPGPNYTMAVFQPFNFRLWGPFAEIRYRPATTWETP